MGIALAAVLGFNIAMRYPANEIVIGITLAIYGGFSLAALPLANELIVETTYPVGEATSIGFPMVASQVNSAITIALSSLVPLNGIETYPDSVCRDGESQDLTWFLSIVIGIPSVLYPFFVYFYRNFIRFSRSQSEK